MCLGAISALAAGSITVTPTNESVVAGGAKQMTATVSGLASNAVMWSASVGMIDANGLYTAPPTVPAGNTATVTAVSAVDSTVMGTATLNIREAGPTVTNLSPSSVPAGTFTFYVNGSGFKNGATVYNVVTPLATTFVSSTQLKATATIYTVGNVYIRVTNPNSMYSSILALQVTSGGSSSNSMAVQPSTSVLPTGATQQFVATLNGAPATSATWSATAGSITPAGLFTAPASVPTPSTVTVTASASGASASATINIVSSTPPTITQVSPAPLPIGIFNIGITGTGFVSGTQATLNGSVLATTYVSPTQLTASGLASQNGQLNLVVSNGLISSAPYAVQAGVANPLVSATAARRFLQQAAFGPTSGDAQRVQQIGFSAWVDEQAAAQAVSNYQMPSNQGGLPQRFLTNATMNADQLRQKVAFAYSQIFVTSLVKLIWNGDMIPYQQLLLNDAFANYRTLLADVTLSPSMGYYLDMANNAKANAAGTQLPNENYAREVLQLFSIGTALLNPDGTVQRDSQGLPVPSYDQKTVTELARVFTGWTYAPPPGGSVVWGAYIRQNGPMVPYIPQHDFGGKTLFPYLANGSIASGLGVQQDLDAALDIIFNHPNTAPFISKLMIQHLVKSNPTPGYVQRVAQAFADNGQGVRGDMTAVVKAVLLDPEARANDSLSAAIDPADGHLQEPALFLAGLFRAVGAQVNDQNYNSYDLANMGQDLFSSPSVFNYWSPSYVVGSVGVTGGEFQIYSPFTSVYRVNLVGSVFSAYSGNVQTYGPGFSADLSALVGLAGTPSTLVDALDLALTAGRMPSQMKQIVTTAVQNETGGNLRRVQTAIILIATSSYYNVWN